MDERQILEMVLNVFLTLLFYVTIYIYLTSESVPRKSAEWWCGIVCTSHLPTCIQQTVSELQKDEIAGEEKSDGF